MTEQGSEEYAPLCLREAAEQAGTSKSTIWRAIKSGRMSATRTDDGGFAIDPAELFRAFPPERPSERLAGQDATALASDVERPATRGTANRNDELAVKLAAAEEKIEGLNSPLRKCRFQFAVGARRMLTTSAAGSASMSAIRPITSSESVCKTKMKAARASAASLGVP